MKVMRLLSSLKHDESERGIFHLGRALVKQGHQSIIVSSASEDEPLVKRLKRDGNIYHQIRIRKKSWWALLQVPNMRRLIEKHNPDIIHIHSRTPAWVLFWALRGLRLRKPPKLVSTMYGFYPINNYGRAIFKVDRLITVSDSVTEYLKHRLHELRNPPTAITRIYRGVDTRSYPYRHNPSVYWLRRTFTEFPELEHKRWLLFPTVVGPQYGQEWVIDILGNLNNKFDNLHVIIMDDDEREGVVYESFRQRLFALDLVKQVTFIGAQRNDMREWLSAANLVLALADEPESIGINVLQAIHLGTPVVGWDKAAFSEILTPLYPQGLVRQYNAHALSEVVYQQLNNVTRPSITDAFTIQQMVDETLLVYEELYELQQLDYSTLKSKRKRQKTLTSKSKHQSHSV